MNKIAITLLILVCPIIALAEAWTPSEVLESGRPRILFTSADSADIAARLSVSPWSSYYSSVWSRANATRSNDTQYDDMVRSKIAMSAGFVLYFGVEPGGDTLTAAARDALYTKAETYLSELLTDMGSRLSNGEYHYPCERLIQYCIAYDLLAGAGYSPPSGPLTSLATTIYDNATYYLLGYIVDNLILFANHKLIVAGALGTAAVTFPGQGGEWIDYAMTKTYYVTFSEESDPSAVTGFSEGPHYLRYSLEHLYAFFLGMKHYTGDITDYYEDPCGGEESGNIRTQWYYPGWDSIYYWISELRLPDGTVPPLDDSFLGSGFCHTAPFAGRDSAFFWETNTGSSRMDMRPMLVAVGANTAGAHPPGLTALPEAGNLIFRTDSARGDIYFHYFGEHGIALTTTHNQSDEASFYLNAGGEDLAFDPGYIQWDERGRVNQADNHNTILVDGSGPATTSPAECFIEGAFEIPNLCFGRVRTEYSGVDIRRNALLFGEEFILLMDDLSSGSTHEYGFQCHGNGLASSGSFSATALGGIWDAAGGVALEAAVTCIGGPDSRDAETEVHETGYLAWEDHTVLRVRKSAMYDKFLAILYPFAGGDPPLRSSDPGLSNRASMRFGCGGLEGISICRYDPGGMSFSGDSILPDIAASASATFALFDSASGEVVACLAMDAESLKVDASRGFRSDGGAVNLAFSRDSSTTIYGFLGDPAADIVFYSDVPPSDVIGASSWSYSAGEIDISLPDSAYFRIEFGPVHVETAPETPENFAISAYPNPFNSAVRITIDGSVGAHGRAPSRVEIFDVNGRCVSVIARPKAAAISPNQGDCFVGQSPPRNDGVSEFVWQPGENITSGVYLVRARVEDKSVSRRVVYLK